MYTLVKRMKSIIIYREANGSIKRISVSKHFIYEMKRFLALHLFHLKEKDYFYIKYDT